MASTVAAGRSTRRDTAREPVSESDPLPGLRPCGCMRVPREKRFSPSQLNTFVQCPKMYWFKHVERLEVERKPAPHLVFGNAIHAALDGSYRLPPEQRSSERAAQIFREAWKRDPMRADAFADREDERSWGLKGLELLDKVAQSGDFQTTVPRALEDWAQVNIEGERQLFGKVDRVDDHPSGDGVIVIDYKTGKCRIAEDGLGDELQAQVYALAVQASLKVAVREVRFIFLEAETERLWEPTELDEIEAELMRLVDEIEATTDFSPRPSRLCSWCDYLDHCPEGQAEVGA